MKYVHHRSTFGSFLINKKKHKMRCMPFYIWYISGAYHSPISHTHKKKKKTRTKINLSGDGTIDKFGANAKFGLSENEIKLGEFLC